MVSQHSVNVAQTAHKLFSAFCANKGWACYTDEADLAITFQGLMHDSPEAYFCDIPRPVKHSPELHPIIRKIEGNIWSVICTKFGMVTEMYDEVEEADAIQLGDELMSFFSEGCEGFSIYGTRIIEDPWDSQRAKTEFLTAYKYLHLMKQIPPGW
jgi:5'-deoxynucleotidase YfbR-like HD superfamily hydrolase